MSIETRVVTRKKRAVGGDLVLPLAGLAFTIYYFLTIIDSPWTAQVSAFFVGSVLMLLIAVFLVRTAVDLLRGQASAGMGGLLSWADVHSGRAVLLVATLGFVFLIDRAGFTLTTLVFLAISMAVLNRGRRLGLIALLSVGVSLGGYLLFLVAFETRFPRGPLERLLENLG